MVSAKRKLRIMVLIVGSVLVFAAAFNLRNIVDGGPLVEKLSPVHTYKDDDYKFSLQYPENLVLRSVDNAGAGKTIVIEDPQSAGGIQIVISPFGENLNLTAERVQRDLPDIVIAHPETIEVLPGLSGLYFRSDFDSFGGESGNIWFVRQNYLYQFSAPYLSDELLREVFATFKFHE